MIGMSETKKIGNKIAEARKRKNISQAELAQKLFISSQAVGKWERGESMPDIITFGRLAETLGVDLNYFSENFQTSVTGGVLSDSQVDGDLRADSRDSHSMEHQLEDFLSEKERRKAGWDMSKLNLVDSDFSGLKNLHEKFSSSNMRNCQFVGSELSGLLLKNNNIELCDFSRSDISNSIIKNSNLANSHFNGCLLKETEFTGSYVLNCDLTGADFSGARFRSGGFENDIFTDVVWNGTSFMDTYFGNVVFEGTLKECSFENCGFKKVRFQGATLINSFFKNNIKMKQVEFVDCKADKITYAFLKINQADLTGIAII